jgi:hypothetical protein
MEEREPCSAYINGSDICKHGFYSKHAICHGTRVGCVTCGHIKDRAANSPMCMRDEIPEWQLVRIQQIIQSAPQQ